MRNSILLFGIPILNRGDLLRRLIDSIDFPIDKLVIVNNGNDAGVADTLEYIKNGGNKHIRSLEVVRPLKNLGVAASWNTIIRSNPGVPYRIICATKIKKMQ